MRKDTGGMRKDTCGMRKNTCGMRKDTCGMRTDTCGMLKDTCGMRKETCRMRKDTCGRPQMRSARWIRTRDAPPRGQCWPVRRGGGVPPKATTGNSVLHRR